MSPHRQSLPIDPPVTANLVRTAKRLAHPLQRDEDLDPLLARIGEAHFALLGEASHGTAEYYQWRTKISQRLIVEKGFRFIAVEGDWPACYALNRYVKGANDMGYSGAAVLAQHFRRWPTWMWANTEVAALADWLRTYNDTQPLAKKVGFYGLDVYSLWESLEALTHYTANLGPAGAKALGQVQRCFEPYHEEAEAYAKATLFLSTSCEAEVGKLLHNVLTSSLEAIAVTNDDLPDWEEQDTRLQLEQNSFILKNAEHYYRTMIRRGPESWNIRDSHMMSTLDRLMVHHGTEAKAIVWAHNTHIGDARFTDMAARGEINIGQLVRQRHGDAECVLVGFASHHGRVIASPLWGDPPQTMTIPAGRKNSWEDVLHSASEKNRFYLFSRGKEELKDFYLPRSHRAIGVVYHPQLEQYGNYVPTVLPLRYDALIYLDETQALRPLTTEVDKHGEIADTFPSAV